MVELLPVHRIPPPFWLATLLSIVQPLKMGLFGTELLLEQLIPAPLKAVLSEIVHPLMLGLLVLPYP